MYKKIIFYFTIFALYLWIYLSSVLLFQVFTWIQIRSDDSLLPDRRFPDCVSSADRHSPVHDCLSYATRCC